MRDSKNIYKPRPMVSNSEKLLKSKIIPGEIAEFSFTLLNNSPNPVILIASDSSIQYVNKALEILTGFSSAELIGRKAPYPWWTEETLQKTSEDFEKAMHMGANNAEELFQKKNGDRFWVEITSIPVRKDGEFQYYLANWVDVSERKRAEDELILYQKQLRSLASELSLVEERERKRLAGDLHDKVGHTLAAMKIKLGELRRSQSIVEYTKQLEQVEEFVEEAIYSTRSLILDLSPPVLYKVGLDSALEWLAEQFEDRYHIRCIYKSDQQVDPISEDMRGLLFRCVNEVMMNIVKHAQAKFVNLYAHRKEHNVIICIEDDGLGFNSEEILAKPKGLGLFSIRERIIQVGGYFEILSKPGQGTRVTIEVSPDSTVKPLSG